MYILIKTLVVSLSAMVFLSNPVFESFDSTPPVYHCSTIECKIADTFGDKAQLMIAIAKAESGFQAQNKGYNCIYDGVSKSCKREDQSQAWSVDCGLLQVNVRGTVCPEYLVDIDGNIKKAHEIYLAQGLTAWSVYTSGKYKKYLD